MARDQSSESQDRDFTVSSYGHSSNGYPTLDQPEKPPFPASLMKEARRQVDLEVAVRWERDRRGLPKDGIDDWKRRSIIYAYLLISVIAGLVFVLLAF